MNTRPLAKWKVKYDAKVAAMDNGYLLTEVLDTHSAARSERGDFDDAYCAKVSHIELTRRLREIGFFPPDDMSHGM